MNTLSKKIWEQLPAENISVPPVKVFDLPERVLQFGTGVLLRGLPDHFINQANKQGIFNGRVLVVKSTATGGTDAFARQDGLYTILEKGVVNGKVQEHTYINAAISRVLSAAEQWSEILAAAANPDLQLIISNTTEVGIVWEEADITAAVPVSFPGRILAFLEERYRVSNGSTEGGMVIVPTELIVDNGTKLRKIVLALAAKKKLPAAFIDWLTQANEFCNSLVDCIVPGKLATAEQAKAEEQLHYRDELMIMSEPYRLWAIETSRQQTREILSFSTCNEGVVLAADINKFRELKLRLLNATHTLSCGLAHLSGFTTVKAAMQDPLFESFISTLVFKEIVPLVTSEVISTEEAVLFGKQVLDRFRNTYIEHLWLNITAQYTSKMEMRVVPLVKKHFTVNQEVPVCMATGFACFLLFMRSDQKEKNQFYGNYHGKTYSIQDDKASLMHQEWQSGDLRVVVRDSLRSIPIFGEDLSAYPAFTEAVLEILQLLIAEGPEKTVSSILAKKALA
jgi:tagaturonate reductase